MDTESHFEPGRIVRSCPDCDVREGNFHKSWCPQSAVIVTTPTRHVPGTIVEIKPGESVDEAINRFFEQLPKDDYVPQDNARVEGADWPEYEDTGDWMPEMTDAEKNVIIDTLYDPVTRPAHYNHKGIECIDAIEASMSEIEFRGYLKGNAMKYLWRYTYKGRAAQDLRKGLWYFAKLADRVEAQEQMELPF